MLELLPPVPVLLVCLLATLIGTAIQRLAGQGYGMVASPILALVAPEYLPSAILLVGIAVGLSSAAFDFSAVKRADLFPGFVGRSLGAFIAAAIAASLAGHTELFAAVIALMVYLGIGLSLIGLSIQIVPASLLIAGTAGGVMGTLTGVGAPPMALLYQSVERRRSAATQNVFFCFGMIVSIFALWLKGLVGAHHIALAVVVLPAVPLGIWISQPLAQRLARRSIRPIALGMAGCAATVLLLKTLL